MCAFLPWWKTINKQTHIIKPAPLTKTTCKRVIGALRDMGYEAFKITVEGNKFVVDVGMTPPSREDQEMSDFLDKFE